MMNSGNGEFDDEIVNSMTKMGYHKSHVVS